MRTAQTPPPDACSARPSRGPAPTCSSHLSRLRGVLLFGALVGLGNACGAGDPARTIPQTESASPTDASAASVVGAAVDADDEMDRLSRWAERLSGAEADGSFGRLDASDLGYVIGSVVAVEEDSDGNVLILDEQYHDLKVFGPKGQHLVTVGRAGRGPGEFIQPTTLNWIGPDTLVITDGTRRGQVFLRRSAVSYELIETFPTQVAVEGACVRRGSLWAHGMGLEMRKRLHLLDRAGGIVRSIAEAPEVDHPILRRRRAVGLTTCWPESDRIVLTSKYFPEIEAFDFGGDLLWSATLPEFLPMEFTIVEGGGLRQAIPEGEGGFNWIVGAVMVDPLTLVVQVGWQTAQSSAQGLDYSELVTYLVSSRTGAVLTVDRRLPFIRRGTLNGFLASEQMPFPRVVRYRYLDGTG